MKRMHVAGMHLLGRLSDRFNCCAEVKARAWAEAKEAWVELGLLAQTPTPQSATYQAQAFEVTLADGPARAFVYHSLSRDRKKEHTLPREIEPECKRRESLQNNVTGKTFRCAVDAEHGVALCQGTTPFRWLTVSTTVVPQEALVNHRGPPKEGALIETPPEYTIQFQVTEPLPEVIQAERKRRSRFVLGTSNLAFDAKTALQEDKGQDQNEHGFRWTKSSIHLGAFWLEKPERVASLGYVLWLALPFARFMRAVVRAELKDQPPLELPYRKVKRPSETVMLEAFRDLDLRRQSHETSTWHQRIAVLPYQRRLLEALDLPIDRGLVGEPPG
jgi:hypothetical protein